MRSSIPLYNALAAHYADHFAVPHRRAYDDLAWEFVQPLLPVSAGCIVDAGCGVGRWAKRFIDLGHQVIGIEQASAMAAAARAQLQTEHFRLIEGSMETVNLPDEGADLVIALGSLQYTSDPERTVARFARWTRSGGTVAVLVDSLVALVLELLATGKTEEALCRLETKQGTWIQNGQQADHHLLDCERLSRAFRHAGLIDVQARGLLVGASALGRERLIAGLTEDWAGQITLERRLSQHPTLADVGKQLLIWGRRDSQA